MVGVTPKRKREQVIVSDVIAVIRASRLNCDSNASLGRQPTRIDRHRMTRLSASSSSREKNSDNFKFPRLIFLLFDSVAVGDFQRVERSHKNVRLFRHWRLECLVFFLPAVGCVILKGTTGCRFQQ